MENIRKLAQTTTYRVEATFINDQNDTQYQFGMGIVLQGTYLATCYHTITPNQGWKLKEVNVIYNVNKDSIGSFDKVEATTNFQATGKQFDFSKHSFNVADNLTDFIILKLVKNIPSVSYKFSTSSENLGVGDQFYVYGNHLSIVNNTAKVDGFLFAPLRYLFSINKERQTSQISRIYHGFIGQGEHGFSGGPVFNASGEIVGISDFGWDSLPIDFVKNETLYGQVNGDVLKQLPQWFEQGYKILFIIDIQFILNRYLDAYK